MFILSKGSLIEGRESQRALPNSLSPLAPCVLPMQQRRPFGETLRLLWCSYRESMPPTFPFPSLPVPSICSVPRRTAPLRPAPLLNINAHDPNLIVRTVALVGANVFDLVDHVEAGGGATEDAGSKEGWLKVEEEEMSGEQGWRGR
jgi:hypothetical protein